MNGSEPLTFQDTGSAFMAVQQNKALRHGGQHDDDHQARQPVARPKGVELKMIEEPMVFQPIGIGMKKDEPALLAKVNETLLAMDKAGEINQLWNKWLGPNTEYKMTRTDKVVPLVRARSSRRSHNEPPRDIGRLSADLSADRNSSPIGA